MLLALLHTPLAAQRSERPDIIRGRIVGPDGQPLAGALVTVRAEESGQLRETVSSARGAYTVLFPTHSPTYAVTARFIGMEPATVRAAWTRDATVLTANVSLTMARNPIELERVTVGEHPRPRPMRDDVQLLGEMGYDAGGAGDVRTPTDGWWNPLDPQRYSVLGTDPSENILTVNGAEVQTVLPNPVGLSGRMSAASGAASKGGTSGGRLAVVMNVLHETALGESFQAVVNGGQGDRGHLALHAHEDLDRSRVVTLRHDSVVDDTALLSHPQAAPGDRLVVALVRCGGLHLVGAQYRPATVLIKNNSK